MTETNREDVRLTRVLGLSAVVFLGFAGISSAQTVRHEPAAQPDARVVLVGHAATFDWHANRRSAALSNTVVPRLSTKTRIYGRGSYICSPAGFGRKSSCYAR